MKPGLLLVTGLDEGAAKENDGGSETGVDKRPDDGSERRAEDGFVRHQGGGRALRTSRPRRTFRRCRWIIPISQGRVDTYKLADLHKTCVLNS